MHTKNAGFFRAHNYQSVSLEGFSFKNGQKHRQQRPADTYFLPDHKLDSNPFFFLIATGTVNHLSYT